MVHNIIFEILNSHTKVLATYPGSGTIVDHLNFGLSYVESQDRCVAYILANSRTMKSIIVSTPDSILGLEGPFIGTLWTAKLILTAKIREDRIVFSSTDYMAVFCLNIKSISE